ncbi:MULTISPECIES: diguanylate cyclase [Gammaproteobacteria]|uniref:sensor domain-containing diguanylate cyclase n=1 Tax=Gammaproteobacteria TaxID=1236 RepID=UPI000DD00EC8|nr:MULTISPECIES: diguanylate cyclase [Gammaproteobacteria]RTE85846.1 sensor domain-containing diguanylate cyclase [Aliidiomarina sp. B3213]TCZ90154.1 sensor domain-containing diguanylate cyclase [Lysobacter sp. N42]
MKAEEKSIFKLATFGIVYFLLARISMLFFSVEPSNISLVWLPAGVALYYTFRWGWQVLPWIFVASFAANISGLHVPSLFDWMLHTTISAAADTLFAFLAGYAARNILPERSEGFGGLFVFLLLCCAVPCAIIAIILATNLYWGGYLDADAAINVGLAIFMADTLGALMIAQLLRAWDRRSEEQSGYSKVGIATSLVAIAIFVLSFWFGRLWIYLSIPTLLFLVTTSKSFYSYASLTLAVLLYNALYAHAYEFSAASVERIEVLVLSISLMLALQVMTIQQRNLNREAKERLTWQARAGTDALTGLANRTATEPVVKMEIERIQRRGKGEFCVAMFDIDHFKEVNDSYGHNVGDQILKEVTKVMIDELRASDMLSRHGGEEFLMFLPATDIKASKHVVERIVTKVRDHSFNAGDELINLTLSAGIAEYSHENALHYDDLIDLADQKLYESKREGRDRVTV